MHVRRLAEFVEGDNAGMVELGKGLRFAGKALGQGRVRADARGQDFQGHQPVELLLPRFVNRAHAAFSEQCQNFQLRKEAGHLLQRGWGKGDTADRLTFAFGG